MTQEKPIENQRQHPTSKRERESSNLQESNIPTAQKTKSNTSIKKLLTPIIFHNPGESKSSYFARLAAHIRDKNHHQLFSAAHNFDKDGLYLYKRPVRSSGGQYAELLSQAGSVFHHVIVYIKLPGKDVVALEFGPDDGFDVSNNFMEEVPAAHVLKTAPELPEEKYLPLMHISIDHIPTLDLEARHVQQAIEFASAKAYHLLKSNCIAFSDFICRIMTGNKVKNAPLIYDCLYGKVPPVDSPLLSFVQLMFQMTWHQITDGSRLLAEFLETHRYDAIRDAIPFLNEEEEEVIDEMPSSGIDARKSDQTVPSGGTIDSHYKFLNSSRMETATSTRDASVKGPVLPRRRRQHKTSIIN